MNSLTILILVLQLASGQSAVSPLVRLRAKIPVDPVLTILRLVKNRRAIYESGQRTYQTYRRGSQRRCPVHLSGQYLCLLRMG